jgi:hypothetical protein
MAKIIESLKKNWKMAFFGVIVVLAIIGYLGMFAGFQSPPPPLENYTQTASVTCDLNQRLAKSRDEFGNIVFDCVDKGAAEGFSPLSCPDPKNITRRTLPNGSVLLACGNKNLETQAINNEGFGLVPGKTCQFQKSGDNALGVQQTCIPLREFNPVKQPNEGFGVIDIQQQQEGFEYPPYMTMGNGSTFGRREAFEEPSFSAGGYGGIEIKPNLNRACTNSERLVAVKTGSGVTNFECQNLN